MSDDDVEYVCGGSLVSPLHIITSAHCLPALGQHAVVLLGQQDLSLDPIRGGGVERRVIRSVTHPDYVHNSVKPYYDLALLTLNYPVPVSDHIMPVCLPALEFPDIISQRSALPTTRYNHKLLFLHILCTHIQVFKRLFIHLVHPYICCGWNVDKTVRISLSSIE